MNIYDYQVSYVIILYHIIYIIKVESSTEKHMNHSTDSTDSTDPFTLNDGILFSPGLAANEFMYADLELFKSKDGSWDAAWARVYFREKPREKIIWCPGAIQSLRLKSLIVEFVWQTIWFQWLQAGWYPWTGWLAASEVSLLFRSSCNAQ